MLRRKDVFSYSPRKASCDSTAIGQLAKKLGVSRQTVKNYLNKTGLIKQCYLDDNGWWRIPASVAIKFVPAESLAVPQKHQKKKGRKKATEASGEMFKEEMIDLGLAPHIEAEAQRRRTPPPKALTPAQEEHARLAEVFRQTGITTQDVLAFIEQEKQKREKAANDKDNAMDKTA